MNTFPHGGDVRGMARELGCEPSDILDFSASINPLGPPDWLRTTVSRAVSDLVHYPDPRSTALRQAAAARFARPVEEIIAGNGTSELLFCLARALGLGRAVIPAPSYRDYATACQNAGMEIVGFPIREQDDFSLDVAVLSQRLKALPQPAAVFLASPNNPTGRTVPAGLLRQLAREHPRCLFVVDEAFGSFVEGFESLAVERPENVAVLISLTKMFAVPGLRLGLAVAAPGLAGAVRACQAPWPVNSLAQSVGVRAVEDVSFEAATRQAITGLREELADGLARLPGLRVFPAAANFLLCRLSARPAPDAAAESSPGLAARLRLALLEKRIAIRDCSNFEGLGHWFIRVAVRSRTDNLRLLEALEHALPPVLNLPRTTGRARAIRRPTPALMIQGAASNAGKSVLTAALCRILRQDGIRVAPFKAQNMSLNSFVTAWGEEIGRAQAVQAQACGLAPQGRMNPVLLKPCSDTGAQVIVLGKPVGNMRVAQYQAYKPQASAAAKEAYDSLARDFDAVILEGAGSPAEINLKAHDIVNMAMARHAQARVLLAGDIDKGGVFAALAGTMELLSDAERALVGGYVLNRFRGDATLLEPALAFLRGLTGKPVLGVVPEIAALNLPEEDSVSFKAAGYATSGRELDIVLVDVPHISNFTDCDALAREPDVGLRVARSPGDLGEPDAVILPGSKNTLADLDWLRRTGLADALLARAGASEIVGICAGLQMLGTEVSDPLGVESGCARMDGLGLLALETELAPQKTLLQSTAIHTPTGLALAGYEIHHGRTVSVQSGAPALAARPDGQPVAWGVPGTVWGTYLHGVFDAHLFRRAWLNALRERKHLAALPLQSQAEPDAALDRLAHIVRASLDMQAIYSLLGI